MATEDWNYLCKITQNEDTPKFEGNWVISFPDHSRVPPISAILIFWSSEGQKLANVVKKNPVISEDLPSKYKVNFQIKRELHD